MKTIIIHEQNVNINDLASVDHFVRKLRRIERPFEVKFDFEPAFIPESLFYHTNLAKITLPNSITRIDGSAFSGCKSLTEIIIPDSVREIGFSAFFNCKALIKIKMPKSLESIFSYAFAHCTSLEEIVLSPSVKSLGGSIFYNCSSLQEITIQNSKEDFFKASGSHHFFVAYNNLISFNPIESLDDLLSENNSIESIMTNLEER